MDRSWLWAFSMSAMAVAAPTQVSAFLKPANQIENKSKRLVQIAKKRLANECWHRLNFDNILYFDYFLQQISIAEMKPRETSKSSLHGRGSWASKSQTSFNAISNSNFVSSGIWVQIDTSGSMTLPTKSTISERWMPLQWIIKWRMARSNQCVNADQTRAAAQTTFLSERGSRVGQFHPSGRGVLANCTANRSFCSSVRSGSRGAPCVTMIST